MHRTSLLTLASIAIVFETAVVAIPAAGQPALPGGSVIISPRVPPGSNSCIPTVGQTLFLDGRATCPMRAEASDG
jgi:hypothetical protein